MGAFVTACGGSSFTSSSSGGGSGASGAGASGAGASAGSAQAGGGALGGGGSAQGGTSSGGHGGKGHGGAGEGGGGQSGEGGGGSPPIGGSGGSSAGSAGSGGASAGSGGSAVITSCPKDAPDEMSACQDDLVCTYGDDVRLNCRTRYTCQNGVFSVAVAGCKPLIACLDRAGGIPMTGSACTEQGEECLLQPTPDYIYCRCDSSWSCYQTPGYTMATCPQVAPNIGQACDSGGVVCQYGSCSYPATYDPTLQCKGKAWQQAVSACATPG